MSELVVFVNDPLLDWQHDTDGKRLNRVVVFVVSFKNTAKSSIVKPQSSKSAML